MKLATIHDGSRDGQLVVVSRDLAMAHLASHIAGTLQRVLDDWNFLSPQLEDLYVTLNIGKARHAYPFDARVCLAPLPRAFLWAPDGATTQRGDRFLRPVDSLRTPHTDMTLKVHPVAITGNVAADADDATALDGVRLLLLAASWHADGAWQGTAFCPVAATPDELGGAWQAGHITRALSWQRKGATRPSMQPGQNGGLDTARALSMAPAPEHPIEPETDQSAEQTAENPAERPTPAAVSRAGPPAATGFGARIAALAAQHGLGAGSLVGGPVTDAGPGWRAVPLLPSQDEAAEPTSAQTPNPTPEPNGRPGNAAPLPFQLQFHGLDGGNVFGTLSLRGLSQAPAQPGAGHAVPDAAADGPTA